MRANRRRGEIEAEFDGEPHVLCLTLGALAELETAFGVDDLGALATRFGAGRLSAGDAIKVIGAGLRGAGAVASDEDVAAMGRHDGAVGFAAVVADLLAAAFGGGGEDTANPPPPRT